MTDKPPRHTECGTILRLNEEGPLFHCPKCDIDIGVEQRELIDDD